MCNSHTKWTAERLVKGTSAFLQEQRRAHLRKELQTVLDIGPSFADKLYLGSAASISGHMLLNMDGHFGGELICSLRGMPRDEAVREFNKHLDAIRRIASEHL